MRTVSIPNQKKLVKVYSVSAICLLFLGCAAMPGQPTARATHTEGPTMEEALMERYDGPRARVAVGDFKVKAAGATNDIGDGLREMLITALFNSNRFIVLEREGMKDILLEQDLGSSERVKRKTGARSGRIEGAEIFIYGVVSEFEPESSGGGVGFTIPGLPFKFGGGVKNAHMAIDVRAVDTSTGRVLFATRVEGAASDYRTEVATRIGGGRTTMPIALGTYNNTPMEKAIRVCIDKAVDYLCTKTPKKYYRHKE